MTSLIPMFKVVDASSSTIVSALNLEQVSTLLEVPLEAKIVEMVNMWFKGKPGIIRRYSINSDIQE